ncbi:MAG: FecR domain-containing protein [Candidatus Pseudobacter hemicellulosilyticus]|uniref:FecR domain-containing protein n=1 Tax=Candidatus Pseudobacter hemicellulosilyticus TaxID=3121375 RepID=A0AAJ6BHN0_9BACT|nr:MAG: FecR domain-containing protein [Pseudobacter sp.]
MAYTEPMDKQYFLQLLQKYTAGTATPEERQLVDRYYNLFQDEEDLLQSQEQRQALKNDIRAGIRRSIGNAGEPAPLSKPYRRKWLMAAAAAVLLLATAASLYLLIRSQAAPDTISISASQQENRMIRLPDGSSVILHAGSSLRYPTSFAGKESRSVDLSGQAYFSIEQQAGQPFIVHTGAVQTTVLGTSFNVKALPGEPAIEVTVKTGKVSVSDNNRMLGIITPRQRITYNTEKISSVLSEVSNEDYLGWTSQPLLFDNLTMAESARLLEEHYHVKIQIHSPAARSRRFTASFSPTESLEHALESICVFNGLTYTYQQQDSTVIINDQ